MIINKITFISCRNNIFFSTFPTLLPPKKDKTMHLVGDFFLNIYFKRKVYARH
nr:MAG TPA: hypothetical protein [Caudoviricetes sp.]